MTKKKMTFDEDMGLAFEWEDGGKEPKIYLLKRFRLEILKKYKKMLADKEKPSTLD